MVSVKIYKVERMDTVPGVERIEPGRIYSDGKSYLAIGCGKGAVSVKDLQLEGKKRMDIGAFLLGFRDPESWRAA